MIAYGVCRCSHSRKKNHQREYLNFSAKPECTTDPECPDHLACITEKCQNPCFTSTCGVNAECRVIKHRATCICNRGYVGDPYRICEERKKYFSIRALTSITYKLLVFRRCQICMQGPYLNLAKPHHFWQLRHGNFQKRLFRP